MERIRRTWKAVSDWMSELDRADDAIEEPAQAEDAAVADMPHIRLLDFDRDEDRVFEFGEQVLDYLRDKRHSGALPRTQRHSLVLLDLAGFMQGDADVERLLRRLLLVRNTSSIGTKAYADMVESMYRQIDIALDEIEAEAEEDSP